MFLKVSKKDKNVAEISFETIRRIIRWKKLSVLVKGATLDASII